jgi:hypothetical protein
MKKTFLFTFLLFILFVNISAQESDFKYWQEGKLTWNDFKGETGFPLLDSELKYFLTYGSEKQKFNDTTVYRIAAKGYIDRDLSWSKTFKKTDQNLAYFQVVFDIVELHRRGLQNKLDRLEVVYNAENELRSAMYNCEKTLADFKKESQQGADTIVVQRWQKTIQTELGTTAGKSIPAFTKRNFGYGMHAGFGKGFNTGTIKDNFPSTFNFIFGFDVAYKDVTLFLCGTLGSSKADQSYNGEINIPKGERAGVAIGDVSLGYPVLNKAKFKLMPFAGLGFLEYSEKPEPDETNYKSMAATGYLFGLNTDYKFRKGLSFFPETFFQKREYVEFTLRARLYVAHANLSPDMKGFSINLTLGLNMAGNYIRISK